MVEITQVLDKGFMNSCEMRRPGSLEQVLGKESVFSAIIHNANEALPQDWVAMLGNSNAGLAGNNIRKVPLPGVELIILGTKLEIYGQRKPSGSMDSDAFYLGHLIDKKHDRGMLLQYLFNVPTRTRDRVAHTSVHVHGCNEIFYCIYGSAHLWISTATSGLVPEEVTDMVIAAETKHDKVEVSPAVRHPLVAFRPSLMLIVSTAGVVEDQVNRTSLHHTYVGPFKVVYKNRLEGLKR